MHASGKMLAKQASSRKVAYFDYIMHLDRAIDAVCQDLHAQGSLEIAGLDLTEAYKRLLYFRYRDSNLLFESFATKAGTPTGKQHFSADIERRLALSLGGPPETMQLCKRTRLLEVARNAKFFVAKRALLTGRVRATKSQVEFLLVPSGGKFFTVLAPLLDRLGAGAAFLGEDVEDRARPRHRAIDYPSHWRLASMSPWPFDPRGYRTLSSLCANLYSAISSCRPRCLVVAEGNSARDAIVGMIGKSLGIPVVCIQHGWSPFMHVGFKNMPYDKFCVWGERFRKVLETENASQLFATTGAHQLNDAQRSSTIRNSVGILLQNVPKKDGRFGLIDEQGWDRSLVMIREVIQKLPVIEFRIRPHPGSQQLDLNALGLDGFSNVKYLRPRQEAITEFFDAVDISISVYSTTLYESLHAGVWPIILDVVGLPTFNPDIATEGLAGLASSSDDLVAQVERFYQSTDWRDRRLRALKSAAPEYFATTGGVALDNMVSCIRGQVDQ